MRIPHRAHIIVQRGDNASGVIMEGLRAAQSIQRRRNCRSLGSASRPTNEGPTGHEISTGQPPTPSTSHIRPIGNSRKLPRGSRPRSGGSSRLSRVGSEQDSSESRGQGRRRCPVGSAFCPPLRRGRRRRPPTGRPSPKSPTRRRRPWREDVPRGPGTPTWSKSQAGSPSEALGAATATIPLSIRPPRFQKAIRPTSTGQFALNASGWGPRDKIAPDLQNLHPVTRIRRALGSQHIHSRDCSLRSHGKEIGPRSIHKMLSSKRLVRGSRNSRRRAKKRISIGIEGLIRRATLNW